MHKNERIAPVCMQSPFALATLSTTAAAINSDFDVFSLMFGPS